MSNEASPVSAEPERAPSTAATPATDFPRAAGPQPQSAPGMSHSRLGDDPRVGPGSRTDHTPIPGTTTIRTPTPRTRRTSMDDRPLTVRESRRTRHPRRTGSTAWRR